jgi:DDE superfamily endonuclease
VLTSSLLTLFIPSTTQWLLTDGLKGTRTKTNSGRQRLNLHGVINAETLEMIVIESETINGDSTIELLDAVSKKYAYSDQLIFILDNAPYHHSKNFKNYF